MPTNDIKIDRAGSDTKEFVADPVENVLPVENPKVRRTAAIEGELRRTYNNYEDEQASIDQSCGQLGGLLKNNDFVAT